MNINDDRNLDPDPLGDPQDDDTLFSWGMMKTIHNAILCSAGYEKRQRLITGPIIDRVRTAFEIFTTCTTDKVVDLVNSSEQEVVTALEELVALGEIFIGDFQYNIGLPAPERVPIWARDEPPLIDVKTDAVQ